MELIDHIPVRYTNHSRLHEVNWDDVGFGNYISDHMLVCHYNNRRWNTAHITPFGELSLSPATLALHYGQSIFEGMKAFRLDDGRINIFRMEKHYERFQKSAERMCMPVIDRDVFFDGLRQLVEVDRDWVPEKEGMSLYIRPFMFASEARFGVKVSDEYYFIIFTGPVGPYFSHPIRVKVETLYVRAARGGTGCAKCAGNYGGAFFPTKMAREEGYDQVLWTDAAENRFIEESGTMNVMFVINGKLVTPPLSDSILDGITRDSLLAIARQKNFQVEERPVSVEELESALKDHTLTEAFGAGTAAVTSPICAIGINGHDYTIPAAKTPVADQLTHELDAIRRGKTKDIFGWNDIR